MRKTQFVRENEIEEIYQCPICKEYFRIPKGCDIPYCECDPACPDSEHLSFEIKKTESQEYADRMTAYHNGEDDY